MLVGGGETRFLVEHVMWAEVGCRLRFERFATAHRGLQAAAERGALLLHRVKMHTTMNKVAAVISAELGGPGSNSSLLSAIRLQANAPPKRTEFEGPVGLGPACAGGCSWRDLFTRDRMHLVQVCLDLEAAATPLTKVAIASCPGGEVRSGGPVL